MSKHELPVTAHTTLTCTSHLHALNCSESSSYSPSSRRAQGISRARSCQCRASTATRSSPLSVSSTPASAPLPSRRRCRSWTQPSSWRCAREGGGWEGGRKKARERAHDARLHVLAGPWQGQSLEQLLAASSRARVVSLLRTCRLHCRESSHASPSVPPQVPGLSSACEQFVNQLIHPLTAITFMEQSLALKLDVVTEILTSYISSRFDEVTQSHTFPR